MVQTAKQDRMVRYQFQIEDEKWERWKNTVPRSKSLEKRIIELIEADAAGRVLDDPTEITGPLDDLEVALESGDRQTVEESIQRIREAVE